MVQKSADNSAEITAKMSECGLGATRVAVNTQSLKCRENIVFWVEKAKWVSEREVNNVPNQKIMCNSIKSHFQSLHRNEIALKYDMREKPISKKFTKQIGSIFVITKILDFKVYTSHQRLPYI